MSSTDDLLDQIKNGLGRDKRLAWEALYVEYAPRFYWRARSRGLSHEEGEDIVQETFFAVLEHIDRFNPLPGRGSAWLWVICSNEINNRWRIKKREAGILVPLPDPANGTEAQLPFTPDILTQLESEALERAIDLRTDRTFQSLIPDHQNVISKEGRGRKSNNWKEAMRIWAEAFLVCFRRAFGEWEAASE